MMNALDGMVGLRAGMALSLIGDAPIGQVVLGQRRILQGQFERATFSDDVGGSVTLTHSQRGDAEG